MAAFRKFVGDHFSYPKEMLSAKESGKVEVYFVIDKEGNPTSFRIINETNKDLGKELARVITKYGTWDPAILNGQKSAFNYSIVVDLSVIEDRYGAIKVGDIKNGDFIKS